MKKTVIAALLFPTMAFAGSPTLKAFSAVGTHVEIADGVSGLRRGPCTPDDCEILTRNNSRWTIFGNTVTRQRYLRSEAGRRLPFGLAGVADKDKSLSIVSVRAGVTLTRSEPRVYDGPVKLQDGTDAILYVKLSPKGAVEEIGVTLGEAE